MRRAAAYMPLQQTCPSAGQSPAQSPVIQGRCTQAVLHPSSAASCARWFAVPRYVCASAHVLTNRKMLVRWPGAATHGPKAFTAVHPCVHPLIRTHRVRNCTAAKKTTVQQSDPQLPPTASGSSSRSSSSSHSEAKQPLAEQQLTNKRGKGRAVVKDGASSAGKARPPASHTGTLQGPGSSTRAGRGAARRKDVAALPVPAAGSAVATTKPAAAAAPKQQQQQQQQQQQAAPKKQLHRQQQQQRDTPSSITGSAEWWKEKQRRVQQLLVEANPATDIPSLADTLVANLDDAATAFNVLVSASLSGPNNRRPRWQRLQPDPLTLELATALATRLEAAPALDSAKSGVLASILSGMGRLGVPNPGLLARLESLTLAKLPGASAAQLIRYGEGMMVWGYSVSPRWALSFLAAVESLLDAASRSPPKPKGGPKGKGAKAAAKGAPAAAASPVAVEHLLTFAAFAAWWGGGHGGFCAALGIPAAEAGASWAATSPAAAAAAAAGAAAAAAAPGGGGPTQALPLLFATAAADAALKVEPHLYPALLAGAGAMVQLVSNPDDQQDMSKLQEAFLPAAGGSSGGGGGGATLKLWQINNSSSDEARLRGLLRELVESFLFNLAEYRAAPLARALEAMLSWPLALQQQVVAPRLQVAPEELLLQIQIQLPHARAPQVVTYLRAVAAWGLQPEESWLEAVLERSHAMLPVCTASELTDLAVALQQLQLRPYRAWWQDYYQRALIEVPSMTASQLVATLQAFSSIGIVFDPSLLHAFVGGLQLHLGTMEAPQLQVAVQALRKMYPDVLPGRTVQLLVEEMERRCVFQGASA